MEIELGIGMFGDLIKDRVTGKYQAVSQRINEIIEEVKLADELGVDSFLIGEHHREDYAVAAPEIMLATLASVTKNIKLVSGVTVLSSADPVKIFQDFSMIDLISNKRAEIVAGRGSFIESFPLFGFNLKDYDELFEEKLNLLLKLNKEERVTWHGKFRPSLMEQTVFPQPEREIPIWIAVGGTPSSIQRAAKLGLPIIFAIIGGKTKQFLPLIDYYKEVYKSYGHPENEMKIMVHSHTFIADTDDYVLDSYYPFYAAQMNKIGKERGWNTTFTPAQFIEGSSPEGALYMGEANYIAEKIIATIELFNLSGFIAHIDVGGPTHAEIMKIIELYGDVVIPQVKRAFS